MVKTPLCRICLRADILCPVDEEKLRKGEITEFDVKVCRLLDELDKLYNIGDDVEFISAKDMGSFVLILAKGNIGRLIGRKGNVLRALRRRLDKPVRIVEVDVHVKKTVQDLFGNVRVTGVNIVFQEEGKKYRILIPRKEIKYLSFPYSDVVKAAEYILDVPFEIVFV